MLAFVGLLPKKVRKRPPKVGWKPSSTKGARVVGQSWVRGCGRGLPWAHLVATVGQPATPLLTRTMGLPGFQPGCKAASIAMGLPGGFQAMQWASHIYMPAATKAAKAALDFSNNQLSTQFLIETSSASAPSGIQSPLQHCNAVTLQN